MKNFPNRGMGEAVPTEILRLRPFRYRYGGDENDFACRIAQ